MAPNTKHSANENQANESTLEHQSQKREQPSGNGNLSYLILPTKHQPGRYSGGLSGASPTELGWASKLAIDIDLKDHCTDDSRQGQENYSRKEHLDKEDLRRGSKCLATDTEQGRKLDTQRSTSW